MQTVMRTRRQASSSSDPVSSTGHRGARVVGTITHTPVLLHEVLQLLDIRADDCVVDATLGGAGHARAIAEMLGESGVLVGLDADSAAVERSRDALMGVRPRVALFSTNFRSLARVLESEGVTPTKILFDLGWSAYQLEDGRGFSFHSHEPLLMTYASVVAPGAVTGRTIVNEWKAESIEQVILGWGEERHAKRIARAIIEARVRRPIETAAELAEIIYQAVPPGYRRLRTHPATRTFQALRIAVNDEMGALKEGLQAAWESLAPGGQIAVISFHSLEDRAVKEAMRSWNQGGGMLITKSPVVASREEVRSNPRARSAKLRVIKKLSG